MKPKYFILNIATFVLVFFGIYIGMFYYQLNSPVKAAWWVHSAYQYKDFKSDKIKSKKIIIVAGSNALFGINSELIEKNTGYPVINLAVHAGLDIDYLYYKIKQNIKNGDIVVMPLELAHYYRDERASSWFSNNMMAWGNDYLGQLSPLQLAKFIINAEPGRILEGALTQIRNGGVNTKILSSDSVIKNVAAASKSPYSGVYNYTGMNEDGDFNIDKAVTFKKDAIYLKRRENITPYFIKTHEKINSLVKDHNGKLYLTYPVTIRNNRFDLSQQGSQNKIDKFEYSLSQLDIKIYCNAALFNLDRMYFFNTQYHPNKYGALIRSNNLGDCLAELINDQYQKLPYDEAINKVNLLQLKYKDKVKVASPRSAK